MALPTAYEVVLLAAMLVTAGVTAYAWRRRTEPGGRFVLAYAAASVLWSTSELAMSLSDPFFLKAFWFTLLFVGVIVSILAWFFFVLVYTGRWTVVTPRNVALFGAVPGVAVLLTLSNPLHGLMFDELFPISMGAGLDIAPGAAFYLWATYSALLLLGSVALLLDTATRVPRFYRRQIGLLAVGAVAPPLGSAIRQLGVSAVDLTPVGLVVSGVALSVAISREGFLDVTPIASDIVVDTIDAAVFVIDRRDRLVDANEAAMSLLGGRRDVVGRHVEEVLGPYPEALDRYREIVNAGVAEAEMDMLGGVYDVTASRLTDHRGRLLGRVILVADVTERKRRERELERQNERLEEFSSVLSHDLRNPLNVADLHLELARDGADDEHLEAIGRSLGRMEDIIDDVLALAREGRTVTDADLQPVGVGTVAERAWAGTPTTNATLSVEGQLDVMADPKRLQRALENLFRNSVEHGPEADRATAGAADGNLVAESLPEGVPGEDDAPDELSVRVGVLHAESPEPDGGRTPVGFFVEDDGRGIPPDERGQVLESGFSSRSGGTGFGLSIVQSIVEAHGWRLDITESEEGGARFEVRGVTAIE